LKYSNENLSGKDVEGNC